MQIRDDGPEQSRWLAAIAKERDHNAIEKYVTMVEDLMGELRLVTVGEAFEYVAAHLRRIIATVQGEPLRQLRESLRLVDTIVELSRDMPGTQLVQLASRLRDECYRIQQWSLNPTSESDADNLMDGLEILITVVRVIAIQQGVYVFLVFAV